MSSDILERLADVIEARRTAEPGQSYVARLHRGGVDTIVRKIGEEATEVIVAAKNGQPREIVYETADLWFHSLVMLVHCGVRPAAVLQELERRFGTSGVAEKAQRGGDP